MKDENADQYKHLYWNAPGLQQAGAQAELSAD